VSLGRKEKKPNEGAAEEAGVLRVPGLVLERQLRQSCGIAGGGGRGGFLAWVVGCDDDDGLRTKKRRPSRDGDCDAKSENAFHVEVD
jgi:hypothetical protein